MPLRQSFIYDTRIWQNAVGNFCYAKVPSDNAVAMQPCHTAGFFCRLERLFSTFQGERAIVNIIKLTTFAELHREQIEKRRVEDKLVRELRKTELLSPRRSLRLYKP